MADLDRDLSRRLARLADAVPTARLDPAHLRAVEARQRVRMAWMTPLVALVVIVVGATLVGGGSEPTSTPRTGALGTPPQATALPNGPVTETVTDGPFELTIRSTKARYVVGEPIEIEAVLGYTGPEQSVQISHGLGSNGGPLAFGIVEPIPVDGGDVRLNAGYPGLCAVPAGVDCPAPAQGVCIESSLERGADTAVPFEKRVYGGSEVPDTDAARAYLLDPELRLPAGTWRLYVIAEFGEGEVQPCGEHALRAQIEIEVIPTPSESSPGVSELPRGSGHAVVDRFGAFALELRAGKARYEVGEAIDVTATLRFDGPEASMAFEHDDNGPIVFGIRERVFGEISVGEMNMLMGDRTTIVRNVPIVEGFQKGGGFDGEHPEVEKLRAWFEDPELHLPEGTWHILAWASGSPLGSRDEGGLFSLSTEIEIVVDDPATEGHPSATQWADKPVYGGDDIGNMVFQVRSAHPTYVVGSPIEFDAYYWLAEGPPLAEGRFIQEAEFSIVQVDPAATEVWTLQPEQQCADTAVGRGEERHVAVDSSNVVLIEAVSWPQSSADALEQGVLDLPVGRWRIAAVVRAEFGPCGNPDETWQVQASLEVDVLPRP